MTFLSPPICHVPHTLKNILILFLSFSISFISHPLSLIWISVWIEVFFSLSLSLCFSPFQLLRVKDENIKRKEQKAFEKLGMVRTVLSSLSPFVEVKAIAMYSMFCSDRRGGNEKIRSQARGRERERERDVAGHWQNTFPLSSVLFTFLLPFWFSKVCKLLKFLSLRLGRRVSYGQSKWTLLPLLLPLLLRSFPSFLFILFFFFLHFRLETSTQVSD